MHYVIWYTFNSFLLRNDDMNKNPKIYESFMKTLAIPNKLLISGTNNHFGHYIIIHTIPDEHTTQSTKYYDQTDNIH